MTTVLLADDNDDIRELLQEFLEGAGYAVIAAADGQEAIDHLAASGIDLIIADINMPRRTGLEVLRTVREQLPEVPVIMLSGQGSGDAAGDEAYRLGARLCLSKPLRDIHTLPRIVADTLAAEAGQCHGGAW
jgi:CheY-like chemotaxis protein